MALPKSNTGLNEKYIKKPTTDIILISKDGCEFHVSKYVLSSYSLIFADIFNYEDKNVSIDIDSTAIEINAWLDIFHQGANNKQITTNNITYVDKLCFKYDILWKTCIDIYGRYDLNIKQVRRLYLYEPFLEIGKKCVLSNHLKLDINDPKQSKIFSTMPGLFHMDFYKLYKNNLADMVIIKNFVTSRKNYIMQSIKRPDGTIIL